MSTPENAASVRLACSFAAVGRQLLASAKDGATTREGRARIEVDPEALKKLRSLALALDALEAAEV